MDSDPRLVVFFIILSTNPKMLQMMDILQRHERHLLLASVLTNLGPSVPFLREHEKGDQKPDSKTDQRHAPRHCAPQAAP